jgi:hypothetical protein
MPYKVLYVRLGEQSLNPRTNPAGESGARPVKEKSLAPRRGRFVGDAVRPFGSASVPLPSPCPTPGLATCRSRTQSGVHRQVAAPAHSARAAQGPSARPTDQRSGDRSVAGVPDPTQPPWLSSPGNVCSVLNAKAATIVMPGRSWHRFTASWYPRTPNPSTPRPSR